MTQTGNSTVCNFCGQTATEGTHLLPGNDAAICVTCVTRYYGTLDPQAKNGSRRSASAKSWVIPRPAEIKQQLDLYCVGQEHAKKTLAVAVNNHYKRIQQNQETPDGAGVHIEKSNILMTGPTGSGKTLLARTLAKILDVPFALVDVATLSESGIDGLDAETILLRLLQNADYQPELARHGIIYIDEIDKIAQQSNDGDEDPAGKRLQHTLLKIIEGAVCRITVRDEERFPEPKTIRLDTSEILFICGGSFVGLEKIIQRRLGRSNLSRTQKNAIAARDELLVQVEPEDVLQFGLIPEFVGRLPIIASLLPLDEAQLVAALTEPKNALVKQYVKLLALEGVELEFTPDALHALASQALLKETGARALRGLVERLMLDVMYEAPESENPVSVKITRPVVEGKIKPVVQHHYWGGTS